MVFFREIFDLSYFRNPIIEGLSYSESMKYVSPGSGLPEGMFNSLEQSQHYELDTRLSFKGYQ